MSSILLDGRDETTVFLPEVDKEDFHNLVRNLYGEKGTKRPSQELLTLLQISELPEIGEDSASTTLTTCKSLVFFTFFILWNLLGGFRTYSKALITKYYLDIYLGNVYNV